MKTIPPPCPEPASGPKHWRSLEELADTPAFREWAGREFPSGASELADPVTRRHFVKIMSASFMLAGVGLTGCRRPVERIQPFTKLPEGYIHGVAQYYATAMPTRGSALPLLVKSHEGRPIKVEGNPLHPDSNGGTDRHAQASILSLYDPDRARRFTRGGNTATREAALDALAAAAQAARTRGGQGLAILLDESGSPSRARLRTRIAERLPQARWFSHEPVDLDVARDAATLAFGRPVRVHHRLDQAQVILALDADILGAEADVHRHIRDFAKGRAVGDAGAGAEMNRLYAVEALFTLTGANADHRLRVPASAVLPVGALLMAELIDLLKVEQRDSRAGQVRDDLRQLGASAKTHAKWIQECARDLTEHAGKSLVLAGHRQPLAVQLIALACNAGLGNLGKTALLQDAPEPPSGSLADLARALRAGEIDTLVVAASNPVYDAPADLDWAQTQRRAKTVIRLGYYEDETSAHVDWHLPAAHYLESWGDARTADGTLVPVQPLVEPLFGGLTQLEVLARLAELAPYAPHEIVRATFRELGGLGEDAWKRFLHDGFLAESAAAPVQAEIQWEQVVETILAASASPAPSSQALEVVFHRDYSVDDGRYVNNGWLQEWPDPITKLTWENAIVVSLQTAKDLGLNTRVQFRDSRMMVPWVKLTLGARMLEGPLWIQPGLADHTVALALGYGQGRAGRVGRGSGYNAYALRTADALHAAAGARLQSAGREHLLASTQSHWSMEGRPVVREANLDQFRKQPEFARGLNLPEPEVHRPLYPNPLDARMEQAPHQWGMAIDLNKCVGCSACVLACQSENNIPIVGKEQVSRSREMHWLRIDRYYSGHPAKQPDELFAHPQMVTQPMLCQHCESAPCESVCPVNATTHDDEGLNLMVYNRCVGTRYCSNNCPYKVRRFNFFDYNRRPLDRLYRSPVVSTTGGSWEVWRWFMDPDRGSRKDDEWDLVKLAKNPDVTVRMRGVMEKCTFCVQRLEQAKIAQKVKAGASGDTLVREGAVKVACQQACPAEAIAFGNLKDPASQVSTWRRSPRDYTVLEFLATKPRVTYLARVRNPNPRMPDHYETPFTWQEYAAKHGDPHAAEEAGMEPAAGPARGAEKGGH